VKIILLVAQPFTSACQGKVYFKFDIAKSKGIFLMVKLAEIMFMQKLLSEKETCGTFDFLE
jgi:hypothetical protein